jgi:hypothetical protein
MKMFGKAYRKAVTARMAENGLKKTDIYPSDTNIFLGDK